MKIISYKPRLRWRFLVGTVLLGGAMLLLSAPPAAGPAEVQKLVGVLQQPGASLYEKARACQQLGEFGDKRAVPALAALLSDEALSAYARSGLEGIPDPDAAAALRAALPRLRGNRLIGVVNSLGVLRDGQAVGALAKLAGDPGSGAAREALLALGRISDSESISILRRTLATGPEAVRAAAAAGSLIAAEIQGVEGHWLGAIALYDAVRAADLPMSYRRAAMRGAIVARKADGLALLVQLLKSEEREVRNVALLTAREMPSARLAEALNTELETAKPELQAQLIQALADCHDSRSLQAVRTRVSSDHPLVRQAALKTLGKIGDQTDAGLLLQGLRAARSPEETAAASASLSRLEGTGVDSLILANLAETSDTGLRIALIHVLDARSPASATPELLKQAAAADPAISLAAFRAMRSAVGLEDLPALLALTKTCQDGPRRAAAEEALFYAATKTPGQQAGDLVLAELKQETPDLDKASWIRTLAAMGYAKALPAIALSLRDPNPWLVKITVDSLRAWPGPAPLGELLGLAESTPDAVLHARALAGALQLATTAGNGRQAPDATVVGWFERAAKAARSADDTRAVLTHLGRWTHAASIRLLTPYLDRAELRNDAASAILAAAGPVAEGPGYPILPPLLDRIAALGGQPFLDRVASLRRSIAATESAAREQKGKP